MVATTRAVREELDAKPSFSLEEAIVYVPQGSSGRVISGGGIKSLYSDGFSICAIVVCFSSNKISMSHVDYFTPFDKIAGEIEWALELEKQGNSIFVFTRPYFKKDDFKRYLVENLSSKYGEFFNQKNLNVVEEEVQGVLVGFKPKAGLQLLRATQKPTTLIHHPKEEIFLNFRKSAQYIGFRGRYHTKMPLKNKQFCIFSGKKWEHLDGSSLVIDTSDEYTKEEMDFFSKDSPLRQKFTFPLAFIDISIILTTIIDDLIIAAKLPFEKPDVWEVQDVAKYFERCLYKDTSYEALLRRNLKKQIGSSSKSVSHVRLRQSAKYVI